MSLVNLTCNWRQNFIDPKSASPIDEAYQSIARSLDVRGVHTELTGIIVRRNRIRACNGDRRLFGAEFLGFLGQRGNGPRPSESTRPG